MLSNNTSLPVLNPFRARSTWLVILGFVAALLNVFGVDMGEWLRGAGIAGTPEELAGKIVGVVEAMQPLLPWFLGAWAWLERRAPCFRLGGQRP